MFVFRKNLQRAIETSLYAKSISKLSVAAALGEKTLGNMLNNDQVDTAKTGPGIFGMKRVADLLGVSLDYLVGQNGDDRPSPVTFMERHKTTGGNIEGFTDLLPFCDLYQPVQEGDTKLNLIAQGTRSLSAIKMPQPSTSNLQDVLNQLEGTKLMTSVISDHLICERKGCFATLEELNNPMPTAPLMIKMDYIRILAHLTDTGGKGYVLNYSFVI